MKKTALFLLAGLLALTVLSGCAGKSTSSTAGTSPSATYAPLESTPAPTSTPTPTPTPTPSKSADWNWHIGEQHTFGNYEWLVLDVQGGKALLLTKDIIEERQYNTRWENIDWADCSLRAYLNGEFYDRFSDAEKARIIESNLDNKNYAGSIGNTTDKVFLLDLIEANEQYFVNDSADKIATYNGVPTAWWLRTSETNLYSTLVTTDGGSEMAGSSEVTTPHGVRPAIWIKLSLTAPSTSTPATTKSPTPSAAPTPSKQTATSASQDLSGTYSCSDLSFPVGAITFNSDGTVQLTMDHQYTGTYKKSGNQYSFSITGGLNAVSNFTAKEIDKEYQITATLNSDGSLTVYVKAKSGYMYMGPASEVFKKK